MKIAVVGSGVSGLVSAWLLHGQHELTVFEAEHRPGGHTHTVDCLASAGTVPVDTGFIVCNRRTYPLFTALCEHLGVRLQETTMSFSVRAEGSGLEYGGSNLNALFCQRLNLLRPRFLRMVREILRFNRLALELLAGGDDEIELATWLGRHGFHREVIEHYVVPMGAAIWSSGRADMLRFPARFFARFFHHHGMLTIEDRPQWLTVAGGSRTYRDALLAPFKDHLRLGQGVVSVRRVPGGVEVATANGTERFDEVVLACHADQALAMLSDAKPAEREILGAIPYQQNEAWLHTDISVMPRHRSAWSAWNYHLSANGHDACAVTYDLSALQHLPGPERWLVTLNHTAGIDPALVHRRISWHHPLFGPTSPAQQRRHGEINGVDGVRFAGAYWGYGFHEDGVRSAVAAVAGLATRSMPGVGDAPVVAWRLPGEAA